MKKNVIVFFGINGVGKSTLVKKIVDDYPIIKSMSGSEILMKAFGGVNRQQLEIISPEEKLRMIEFACIEAFERYQQAKYCLLDTHLVVPIRKAGTLILENMWSIKYLPYIQKAYLMIGDPQEILERRIRDESVIGRKRDLNIANIISDQEINLMVFKELIVPNLDSEIIISKNGLVSEGVHVVASKLF